MLVADADSDAGLSPHPLDGGQPRRRRAVRRSVWALAGVIAFGLVLRGYAMAVATTVVTTYYTGDSGRFMRVGFPGMFSDAWQPAGYPIFLEAVRSVSDYLPLTVGIQHLLGVATAVVLFLAARAGGAAALAVLPAAWVMLSADHVFLEKNILLEPLWMPLLAAGLACAVVARRRLDVRWLAGAGALLALSITVRNVSLLLPPLVALWTLLRWDGRLTRKVVATAWVVVPAAAVMGAYLLVAFSHGPYSGIGEMNGWSLYQRVGQFADCTRFTPPEGTAGLCDHRPPAVRPGPFYWHFELDSPARTAFPNMSPEDDDAVGRFARAAVIHQPLDYARAVTKDVARYFISDIGGDRPLSGSGPDKIAFFEGTGDPLLTERVEARYTGFDPDTDRGIEWLMRYRNVFHLRGWMLFALIVLSAVAVFRGDRPSRDVAMLVTASALVLLLMPPLLSSYDARYAIPPAALLTVSAALGLTALRPNVRGET